MNVLYTNTQLLFSAKYIVVLPKRLHKIKIIDTIYIGIADSNKRVSCISKVD